MPCDVWDYIIRFYYILKCDEQWRQFNAVALSINHFIMPVGHIEVPLYDMNPHTYVAMCYKVNRFYWGSRGLFALAVDQYCFRIGSPNESVNNDISVILMIQHQIATNMELDQILHHKITPIGGLPKRVNKPITTRIFQLDSLPLYKGHTK